ncbi:MAG: ABC transporter permease [Verrucomicrobiae bacterium]|jgi:putative ABC transport system permease protein|nr:ABC transporter permease [Verrucomicrobiae bacterium]
MKYLPLIWANLKRRKLRTGLTMSSILIAFLLFGYLCAIKEALSAGVSVAGADRLIVRHKVSIIQLLPQSYLERIRRIEGVKEAAHATWFGGIYQEPRNFFAQIPVVPEEYFSIYDEFRLPEAQMKKWLATKNGAVVGKNTADRFGWKIGDRIPIQATIYEQKNGEQMWEFDLVGIYDSEKKGADTTQFFFRQDYFDEAQSVTEGMVGWYLIRVDDSGHAEAVAKAIDEEFANSPYETKAETEGAFVQGFAKQIGNITAIMIAIMSAVFFTILLVAGNTIAQSVRERTEEIGVLKSLGFTNLQVLGLVLGESCFLSVLAGGAGLALAFGLISRGDPTNGSLPIFYLPTTDLITGILLMLVLGLLTGLAPAIQATRLKIADALRRAH